MFFFSTLSTVLKLISNRIKKLFNKFFNNKPKSSTSLFRTSTTTPTQAVPSTPIAKEAHLVVYTGNSKHIRLFINFLNTLKKSSKNLLSLFKQEAKLYNNFSSLIINAAAISKPFGATKQSIQNATKPNTVLSTNETMPIIATETRLVVYTGNSKRINLLTSLTNTINKNSKSLLGAFKQEAKLYNNFSPVIIKTSTISKPFYTAEQFIHNNEKILITAGLDLLDNEKFLNRNSYLGLFKRINLNTIFEPKTQQNRLDYLAAILCISWALSAISKTKGHDVLRGSYTIVNNTKIYEFLLGYTKLVTKSQVPGFFTNSNSFAYGRNPKNPLWPLSSHYKQEQYQYGIDMRFEESGEPFKILPHSHTHILFGHITATNSTFIKFEHHGMGTMKDILAHGIDLANSGKTLGITHREKDVPVKLKQIYLEFCKESQETEKASLTVNVMWQHINDYISTHVNLMPVIQHENNDWNIVNADDIIVPATVAKKQFIDYFSTNNLDVSTIEYRYGEEVHIQYHAPEIIQAVRKTNNLHKNTLTRKLIQQI